MLLTGPGLVHTAEENEYMEKCLLIRVTARMAHILFFVVDFYLMFMSSLPACMCTKYVHQIPWNWKNIQAAVNCHKGTRD